MTAIFRPIRALRENIRQIGAAVNASREFSKANQLRADNETSCSGIPF
jgi:hypothetical protein